MQSFANPSIECTNKISSPHNSKVSSQGSCFPANASFPSLQLICPQYSQEASEKSILLRKKSHEKLRHCAFSPEEDANLRKLVSIHGETNWLTISLSMYRRSARQCRERWSVLTKREESKRPWTEEEDALLVQKCIELGPKWGKIELFFLGRNSQSLKCRWKALTKNAEIDSLMMSEQNQLKNENFLVEPKQEDETQDHSNNLNQHFPLDISSNHQLNSIQNSFFKHPQEEPANPKENENFDYEFWEFLNFNNDNSTEDLFSCCW